MNTTRCPSASDANQVSGAQRPAPKVFGADTWIALGLALVTFWTYHSVGQFEFVSLDDPQYVTQCELVQNGLDPLSMWGALTEIHADNWHPLLWWSLMLDVELFGLEPGPFHLINVGWHVVNTLLAYWAFVELTGDRWRSALVAAVFGVHPAHVESVAWISERKDVLSGFFWMLGLWSYARWGRSGRSWAWWMTTGCVALGLMSKQILVTLPCVFLLLDYWPLARARIAQPETGRAARLRELVAEKVPWFAMCAFAIWMAIGAQSLARDHAADWPFLLRLSNAPIAVARYLGTTFWPVNLIIPYAYNVPTSMVPTVLATILVLAVTVLAVIDARRHPAVLVGWLWFLGTLMPVIGLVQVGQQSLADRYLYLPMTGLCVAFFWRVPTPGFRAGQYALATISAGVVAGLAVLATRQASVWRETRTLFAHTLSIDPTNDTAHYVLASLEFQAGKVAEGAEHLEQAVLWDRRRLEARVNYGTGRTDVEQASLNRRWSLMFSQIGEAQLSVGRHQDAVRSLRQAVRDDPDSLPARILLGRALVQTGDREEARHEFERVLQRDPGHPEATWEFSRLAP